MAEIGILSRTKRVVAQERLAHIHDVKARTIGVDKAALDVQVAEKIEREKSDKLRDLEYDRMAVAIDNRLQILEQEKQEAMKAMKEHNASYWLTQPKHTRKEWDLSNPENRQLPRPTRDGDHDPRLGASSIQVFAGEDLRCAERRTLQKVQQAAWNQQMVSEKVAEKVAEKEEDKAYAALLAAKAAAAQSAELAKAAEARYKTFRFAAENKAIAEQAASRAYQEKVLDEAEKEVDLANTHNSKLLAEANGHLRTKGGFRGFHPEELSQFREYQAVQREEAKAKAKAAVDEERAFARYADDVYFEMGKRQAKMEEFRKANRVAMQEAVMRQAEEKAAKDAALKAAYKGSIDPHFFGQFATSHR